MLGKSLKIHFLLGTLIGILGLFYSGWTPSILAFVPTDQFIPARNLSGSVLTNPEGITVDSTGNIWITHYNNNSVSKLDSNGKPLSPSGGFTVNGLNLPFGISIDSTGNIWVANEGNSITELIGVASPAQGDGELSGSTLETLLNIGGKTMETLNVFGAEMLPNELTLLKIIVGVGFIGWILLLLVQTVLLANIPGEESGLDEYGCHLDKKTGTYHCVTGQLAGRDFSNKEEMLKLAA